MTIRFVLSNILLFQILIIKTVFVKQIYSDKCCFNAPNGDIIVKNCAYALNDDCCKKYDCTKESIRTMTDDDSVYIYYTPWYMRWYIWFTIGLIFFLCSAFCTFCKKKNIFTCFKQNRTTDLLLITNRRRELPSQMNEYNTSINNECPNNDSSSSSSRYCYTISGDRFLRNTNIDAPPSYWQSVETPYQYANYNRSNNIDHFITNNNNTNTINTSTQNLNYSNHEIQVRPPAYNTLNKSLFHKPTNNDKNEANNNNTNNNNNETTTTVSTTTTIGTAFQ